MKEAQEVIDRYPEEYVRSALLSILHLVQSEDGYVLPSDIELCAELSGLNPVEVSAVATLHIQHKRRPSGEHTAGVCVSSLCAVVGGGEVWDTVCKHLGVGHEKTIADSKITLEALECNTACDYAPVIMVNWEFLDNQTPESTMKLVDDLWAGNPADAIRGPKQVPTPREGEHLLAGFKDGHIDEGASAGDVTLLDKRVTKSHGWGIPTDPGWLIPEKEGETQWVNWI